jgi:chromate reductase, NAD(P)H dehydrogenase (quinone)
MTDEEGTRTMTARILAFVLPDQIAVAKAHEAFSADGSLKDSNQQSGIERLGHTLASFLMKLKG